MRTGGDKRSVGELQYESEKGVWERILNVGHIKPHAADTVEMTTRIYVPFLFLLFEDRNITEI